SRLARLLRLSRRADERAGPGAGRSTVSRGPPGSAQGLERNGPSLLCRSLGTGDSGTGRPSPASAKGGRSADRLAAVIAGCSNHPGAVWHVDGHPATLAASGHRAPAGWFCHFGAAVSALCAPVWVRRTGVVD